MDPYVIVEVGKHHYKTIVALNQGVTPVWNETFTFNLEGKEADVKFKVYDKDKDKDDYIAAGSFPLVDHANLRNAPQAITLYHHSGLKKIGKGVQDMKSKFLHKPADYSNGKTVGTLNCTIEFVPMGTTPIHDPNTHGVHTNTHGMPPTTHGYGNTSHGMNPNTHGYDNTSHGMNPYPNEHITQKVHHQQDGNSKTHIKETEYNGPKGHYHE